MPISPWIQGDGEPTWTVQLTPDTGPFNITGLVSTNFVMKFKNIDTGAKFTGGGTFSNLTAASGSNPATIQYQVATSDVATTGTYRLRCTVTFPNNLTQTFDLGEWTVEES